MDTRERDANKWTIRLCRIGLRDPVGDEKLSAQPYKVVAIELDGKPFLCRAATLEMRATPSILILHLEVMPRNLEVFIGE